MRGTNEKITEDQQLRHQHTRCRIRSHQAEKQLIGRNASGPRLACPTGSTASSASGRLRRKVGMVEMIHLADEPWAPVAQGHPGAEVVRSVRVALRGTNDTNHAVAASDVAIGKRAIRNSRALDCYLRR